MRNQILSSCAWKRGVSNGGTRQHSRTRFNWRLSRMQNRKCFLLEVLGCKLLDWMMLMHPQFPWPFIEEWLMKREIAQNLTSNWRGHLSLLGVVWVILLPWPWRQFKSDNYRRQEIESSRTRKWGEKKVIEIRMGGGEGRKLWRSECVGELFVGRKHEISVWKWWVGPLSFESCSFLCSWPN